MLEKPDLEDDRLLDCLKADYGLSAIQVTFLPLGADQHTAAYRIVTEDATTYFLKLRSGLFDETSVALPKFLSQQGIGQIIPPLPTRTGLLWANLEPYKLILYPFVEGQDGYDAGLTNDQWAEFGRALRQIHALAVPSSLVKRIRRETYSARWRDRVTSFLDLAEGGPFDDSVARKLAAFLSARREQILDLVDRADRLAETLRAQTPDVVLCHSDLHAGNILITASDAFYIVDWDEPILAPKERDLMYVGGGLMGGWRAPQEEEYLFYRGYGQAPVDPIALAYYRYERIVQDIAAFCEQLFLTTEGGADREQAYRWLTSTFLPNHTLEIAYRSDKTLTEG